LEEIIFENLNISENNIISVELAKVLGYLFNFSITYPVDNCFRLALSLFYLG
jgi:hypothetical protein